MGGGLGGSEVWEASEWLVVRQTGVDGTLGLGVFVNFKNKNKIIDFWRIGILEIGILTFPQKKLNGFSSGLGGEGGCRCVWEEVQAAGIP